MFIKVIRIVLYIRTALNLCMERNDDQTPPGTVIRCPDLRQMVCVEHNRMGRRKIKRILELLFTPHLVRGTQLFQDGR